MEQDINVLNTQPDYQPIRVGNIEHGFDNGAENFVEHGQERTGSSVDGAGLSKNDLPTIALPAPVIGGVVADENTTGVTIISPLVAGDDDLIEKEWVEKAKKIVADTHDDPYAQDKAVGQLQADYINKRYGRKLESSSEL